MVVSVQHEHAIIFRLYPDGVRVHFQEEQIRISASVVSASFPNFGLDYALGYETFVLCALDIHAVGIAPNADIWLCIEVYAGFGMVFLP